MPEHVCSQYFTPCSLQSQCNVQVNVTKVWLTLSSIIVALSFAFSNTIMNLFNSVIMLFVVHPFDVGDALLIATNTTATSAAEYVVVEELSLQVRSHFLIFAMYRPYL